MVEITPDTLGFLDPFPKCLGNTTDLLLAQTELLHDFEKVQLPLSGLPPA